MDDTPESDILYVHSVSNAGRLLPSSSRWNSIELEFNVFPKPRDFASYESLPSKFTKSVDFNLVVTNKKNVRGFIYAASILVLITVFLCILLHFLINKQNNHHAATKDLTFALKQALIFFDAQKSGLLPKDNKVMFRGDSGSDDGNGTLVGGFYDSGNNIKFSFPTAYTISLLSWSVIEYHTKYEDISELDHIKSIIKWGSDYLLKLFVPPNGTSLSSTTLFSQVGGIGNNIISNENDISCWQRPEDMRYKRIVSSCDETATDLAGEIIAALSAASLVFNNDDETYSKDLIRTGTELFDIVTKEDPGFVQGTYTMKDKCGGQARQFYNSTGYKDELVWGGTWLFFATGNMSYLKYATDHFVSAEEEEISVDKGIFYWNNKLAATAVLLTRLRFFSDLGYPYENSFMLSTNYVDSLMCSYLSPTTHKTQGGLILLKQDPYAPLELAATATFLSKLYSDYLALLPKSGSTCIHGNSFTVENLQGFSMSQINYILGDNPMNMSYVVGYGNSYPKHIHHRGASIPLDNRWHSCEEGTTWLNSEEPNPNELLGAMVRGPNENDLFIDERNKPMFTEPTISSNAGLVSVLIALHDPPRWSSPPNGGGNLLGIDKFGIFQNIK
uniref:endoglucanase 9-like n=1 Tax=Erigeron canadensis TaxID=72917 RepID=UPI001CB96856|nr:endoglucanase 9-like [Erigeron canadensis]